MPPQQGQTLLDLGGEIGDFRAHGTSPKTGCRPISERAAIALP
jgi:hypothetical protein